MLTYCVLLLDLEKNEQNLMEKLSKVKSNFYFFQKRKKKLQQRYCTQLTRLDQIYHLRANCKKLRIIMLYCDNKVQSKVQALNNSAFCTSRIFLQKILNMGHCFLHKVEIKVVFILKIFCFLFARIGFHRLRSNAAHKSTKTFGFAW